LITDLDRSPARVRTLRYLVQASAWIRSAKRALISRAGGVIYSEGNGHAGALCRENRDSGGGNAGRQRFSGLRPSAVGRTMGGDGTSAANKLAGESDLIIGIGTRYSDFTTASVTAFKILKCDSSTSTWRNSMPQNTRQLALTGDARATLEELDSALASHSVSSELRAGNYALALGVDAEVERIYNRRVGPPLRPWPGDRLLNSRWVRRT